MPRFRSYTQLDSPPIQVADTGFKGVNARLEPHLLPQGMVSDAVNMRFNHGVSETRLGTTFQAWANKLTNGVIQAWGVIYGVGVFTDPATRQQYLIVAADGNIYYTLPNNVPVQMTLPIGLSVNTPCTFTQGIGVLLCHQGEDRPTLVVSRITQPWTQVLQKIDNDGTSPIPNASRSIFCQNRIFIPHGNDEIAVSDFNDYTKYLAGLQDFAVNQGSADKLVAIYKFNDETIVAFKEHSIYNVTGVSGTLQGTVLDEVTNKFGLIAPNSIAQVGNDLWFLSELGVMSLQQTALNKVQGVSLPQSDPIQPLIDRINWRYASGASAAYWNNRYYLAVPFDDAEVLQDELCPPLTALSQLTTLTIYNLVAGARYRWIQGIGTQLVNGTQTITASSDFIAQGATVTLSIPAATIVSDSVRRVFKGVNNAILVYDFLNDAWSGYDVGQGLMVQQFFLLNYQGQRRLFFISNDGWVKLYEESFEDQLAIPYTDVTVTDIVRAGDTLVVNGGGDVVWGDPTTGSYWGNVPTPVWGDPVLNQVWGDPATGTYWGGQGSNDSWGTPGTVITAVGTNTNNSSANYQWGISPLFPILPSIAANLFTDIFGNGGFYPGAVNPWAAPYTTMVTIPNGVRFYSTNGQVPEVVYTPSTSTVSVNIEQVGTAQIESSVTTRGYVSPGQDLEDLYWLSCDIQTWNPEFSIDLLTEGAGESQTVVYAQTKNRRKFYRPFNHPDYVPGNSNEDGSDRYRQDYSVALGGTDDPNIMLWNGLNLEQHQETREVYRTRIRGRSVRAKFLNTKGRLRLMSVKMEGKTNFTKAGTFA